MQTAALGFASVERHPIRRNFLAILSGVLGLAVILVIWWMIASHLMKAQISQFINEEQAQGRTWSCGDWSYGGFPFRTDAQCKDLTASREGVSRVEISVPSLALTSSIFNPFGIWIEVGSPLKLIQNGGAATLAQWRAARAELRTGFGSDLKDMSVTLDELVINDPMSRGSMKLAHGQADVQKNSGPNESPNGSAGLDINASADFLDFAALGAPGYRATFSGRLDRAAALLKMNGLDEFQKSGGRVIVDHLSLKRPKQDLSLKGFMTITNEHRLDGSFDIQATGIGNVLGGVVFNPDMDRDDIEIRLPVLIKNGVLSVGPYRLGEVAPLY